MLLLAKCYLLTFTNKSINRTYTNNSLDIEINFETKIHIQFIKIKYNNFFKQTELIAPSMKILKQLSTSINEGLNSLSTNYKPLKLHKARLLII